VHGTQRGAPAAAIPLLEQASTLLPGDGPTSLALSAALRAAGRPNEATEVLRAMIASYGVRRPKDRALAHHALADTLLASGDRAGALAELDVASRIDPAHPGVLRALGDLAFSDGQLDRAQRAYRALLLLLPRRVEKGGAGRAAILLRLAETESKKGDAAKAAELVEAAFAQAAEHPVERPALESELRSHGQHELLARSLKARLAARTESPAAERAEILGELARLLDEQLGRAEQAFELTLEALALCVDDASLHESARRRATDDAARERYVATVTRALERGEGDAGALWVHVGRAYLGRDDTRAARAFERAPGGLAAAPDVGDALEEIYDRAGDTVALARLLTSRVETAIGEAKAEPLYRLARAYARAHDPERAMQALDEAAAVDRDEARALERARDLAQRHPDSVPLLRAFERRARSAGRDRELIDALALLADVDEGGHGLLREAADLAERTGDRDLAERMLRRAVDLPVTEASREAAAAAMLALAELRTRAGAVGDAAALKDRAASLVEVGDQRALRLEVARLCATELGDLPRAAALYEALLAREPGDPEVWRPLADVYRKLRNDGALAGLIDRVVATADDARDRATLRVERATLALRSEDADRDERAMTLLGEALDDDPTQREAALLLSELLERSGKRGDLAAHLARRIEAAKDRGDASSVSALSLRLGALLEEDGRVPDARDVYHGALDWDPKSRDVLRALFRIEETVADPLDLVAAMERLLAVESGPEAVELAIRLASVHEANGDPRAALAALEQGYRAFPESERLRRELGQRYAGDHEKTAALHRALADARTGAGKLEPLRRVAEELLPVAPDRAIAALEAALAIDPGDPATVAAMIAACNGTQDWERAERALTAAIAKTPDAPDFYWERARVFARRQDVEGALTDLQQAHELGRPCNDELLFVLEAAISQSTDPVTQRAHRRKRAGLLAGKGDRDGARTELAYLLRADPKDGAGLRMLATIEREDERWDSAISAYRRLLSLEEGVALADCALELSEACERAGRLGDARAALERALRAVPGDGRVRPRLIAVYRALGERRELGALTLEDAGRENDVAERFRLLLDATQLFLDAEPSDVTAALGSLEQARRLRPEDDGLTALVAEATARGGRPDEAIAALDVAIKAHRGKRSKALSLLHRKRSSIQLAEGDLSAALESLERAFESDMSNAELALALGQLALDIDDRAVATRAYRSVTMMRPAPAGSGGTTTHDKAVAYLQMAKLAVAEGDPRKGRLFAEKALAEDATFEPARAFLDGVRTAAPLRS
jgi:tetratricopeptide (TPR) repeat protein